MNKEAATFPYTKKRRFIKLSKGIIEYYADLGEDQPDLANPKGKIDLTGWKVVPRSEVQGGVSLQMELDTASPIGKRKLEEQESTGIKEHRSMKLFMKSHMLHTRREKWEIALAAHIAYRNSQYKNSPNS
jgi:hypothetical protein